MDVELTARRSAADQYREAFERLKLNKPQLLTKGTPVTQNNVAGVFQGSCRVHRRATRFLLPRSAPFRGSDTPSR